MFSTNELALASKAESKTKTKVVLDLYVLETAPATKQVDERSKARVNIGMAFPR